MGIILRLFFYANHFVHLVLSYVLTSFNKKRLLRKFSLVFIIFTFIQFVLSSLL